MSEQFDQDRFFARLHSCLEDDVEALRQTIAQWPAFQDWVLKHHEEDS